MKGILARIKTIKRENWPIIIAIPISLSISVWAILADITNRYIFDIILLACVALVIICVATATWLNSLNKRRE